MRRHRYYCLFDGKLGIYGCDLLYNIYYFLQAGAVKISVTVGSYFYFYIKSPLLGHEYTKYMNA